MLCRRVVRHFGDASTKTSGGWRSGFAKGVLATASVLTAGAGIATYIYTQQREPANPLSQVPAIVAHKLQQPMEYKGTEPVFDRSSFDVPQGNIIVVCGPSGYGKSEAVRLKFAGKPGLYVPLRTGADRISNSLCAAMGLNTSSLSAEFTADPRSILEAAAEQLPDGQEAFIILDDCSDLLGTAGSGPLENFLMLFPGHTKLRLVLTTGDPSTLRSIQRGQLSSAFLNRSYFWFGPCSERFRQPHGGGVVSSPFR